MCPYIIEHSATDAFARYVWQRSIQLVSSLSCWVKNDYRTDWSTCERLAYNLSQHRSVSPVTFHLVWDDVHMSWCTNINGSMWMQTVLIKWFYIKGALHQSCTWRSVYWSEECSVCENSLYGIMSSVALKGDFQSMASSLLWVSQLCGSATLNPWITPLNPVDFIIKSTARSDGGPSVSPQHHESSCITSICLLGQLSFYQASICFIYYGQQVGKVFKETAL